MSTLWELNLIRFLDFYLVLLFVASVVRRFDFYRALVSLISKLPGRWPKLFRLAKSRRTVFLSLRTILPAGLALGLAIVQLIASRVIWPEAAGAADGLSVRRLVDNWPALFVVFPLGLAMIALDIWSIVTDAQIDRPEVEKYFDQAEYWLRSRTAHVVRICTLGFIDPRQMVAGELDKALADMNRQVRISLWWLTCQLGLRIAFGLSLWLTWALTLWQWT